jgi:hypothetical protein
MVLIIKINLINVVSFFFCKECIIEVSILVFSTLNLSRQISYGYLAVLCFKNVFNPKLHIFLISLYFI